MHLEPFGVLRSLRTVTLRAVQVSSCITWQNALGTIWCLAFAADCHFTRCTGVQLHNVAECTWNHLVSCVRCGLSLYALYRCPAAPPCYLADSTTLWFIGLPKIVWFRATRSALLCLCLSASGLRKHKVFVGEFAKLREAIISFVMSARPPVSLSTGTVLILEKFHEILCLFMFPSKICRENSSFAKI